MTDAPNPTGASKLDFLWRFRISQLTHPTTVVAGNRLIRAIDYPISNPKSKI